MGRSPERRCNDELPLGWGSQLSLPRAMLACTCATTAGAAIRVSLHPPLTFRRHRRSRRRRPRQFRLEALRHVCRRCVASPRLTVHLVRRPIRLIVGPLKPAWDTASPRGEASAEPLKQETRPDAGQSGFFFCRADRSRWRDRLVPRRALRLPASCPPTKKRLARLRRRVFFFCRADRI